MKRPNVKQFMAQKVAEHRGNAALMVSEAKQWFGIDGRPEWLVEEALVTIEEWRNQQEREVQDETN